MKILVPESFQGAHQDSGHTVCRQLILCELREMCSSTILVKNRHSSLRTPKTGKTVSCSIYKDLWEKSRGVLEAWPGGRTCSRGETTWGLWAGGFWKGNSGAGNEGREEERIWITREAADREERHVYFRHSNVSPTASYPQIKCLKELGPSFYMQST